MESTKPFYRKLNELIDDTPVAVATIIRVRGSVPREVGAKMMIHPLGQHYGTVGGGSGESQIVEVDLTEDISMQSLGVCGGIMDVYVERWP